jgi:hypothetical protein
MQPVYTLASTLGLSQAPGKPREAEQQADLGMHDLGVHVPSRARTGVLGSTHEHPRAAGPSASGKKVR